VSDIKITSSANRSIKISIREREKRREERR